MTDYISNGMQNKSHFFQFVVLSCIISLAFYVFAGVMIVRYGTLIRNMGWEITPVNGEWVISYVDRQGPANDKLQLGDILLSINSDYRVRFAGPDIALREMSASQTQYRLSVRRNGQEQHFDLQVLTEKKSANLILILSQVAISLAFFAMALLVGYMKPEQYNSQIAYLALLISSHSFLYESLRSIWEFFSPASLNILFLLGLTHPLHFAFAYHFYYRFSLTGEAKGFWLWVQRFLYAFAILVCFYDDFVRQWFKRSYETAAAFYNAYPYLSYMMVLTYLELSAVVSLLGVMIYNYRLIENADQRRRVRFILFSIVVGFLPLLFGDLLFALGYANAFGLSSYTPDLIASFVFILIPVSTGFAIVKYQMFDIKVIIRLGLQFLLAQNVLRLLLSLPSLGIVYVILSNPNRTLSEILFQNSIYFYVLIIIAAAISLKFRSQLQEWINRKFFRETYSQEKLLVELVDKVKSMDTTTEIAETISREVETALHPESLYLFYREYRQQDLLLGYSSGGVSSDLILPSSFRLLRFIEDQGGSLDFPFPPKNRLPQEEKDWLMQLNVNLIVPMVGTDEHVAGIMLLGAKKSEEPYTPTDRKLLEAVTNQLAIIYENKQLKQHVRDEKRVQREVLAQITEHNLNLLKECLVCGSCFDFDKKTCTKDGSELVLSLPVERVIEKRYRLENLLGKGGMGAVYVATDLRIDRKVAIKLLLGNLFGEQMALRRFKREAKAVAKLNHRNVIAIHDYGSLTTGNSEGAFMVMELAKGTSMRSELKKSGQLNTDIAATWFGQILDGIGEAHRGGIIHRDIKPENVLIIREGKEEPFIKILDFGLAKVKQQETKSESSSDFLTTPGTVMGTYFYMSPEQIEGRETDERSDLYSIGVMVIESLTGERPFTGRTYHEIFKAILHDSFHLKGNEPEVQRMDGVLQKCIAKEPGERYASALEMKTELIPAIKTYPQNHIALASTVIDDEMTSTKTGKFKHLK